MESVQELLGGKGILWVKGIRRGCQEHLLILLRMTRVSRSSLSYVFKIWIWPSHSGCGYRNQTWAMTRDQAINLVNLYDNQPPKANFEAYAKYYGISMELFLETIDKFANKNLFEKVDGEWKPL